MASSPSASSVSAVSQVDDDAQVKSTMLTRAQLREFSRAMGWKTLVLFICGYSCVGQMGMSLTGNQLRALLWKQKHIPSEDMQLLNAVAALPGSMMPVAALLMAAFPILRKRRGPYVVVASVLGVIGALLIGLFGDRMSGSEVAICLFFINLQIQICGVCLGGRQMEKINQFPKLGPMMVAFVLGSNQVLLFLTNGLSGVFTTTDGVSATVPFLVAVIPLASIIPPALFNFFEEQPVSLREVRMYRQKQVTENYALTFLAALVWCLSTPLLFINVFAPEMSFFYGCGVLVVASVAFSMLLRPILAKFFLWLIIYGSVCMINNGASSVYFLTDSAKVYPDGPHWSDFVFGTLLPMLANVSALGGMVLYASYLAKTTFRTVIAGSMVTLFCLAQMDTLLYSRENLKLGIPDCVLVLGADVLMPPFVDFIMQSMLLLVSKLCVPGLEAPTVALMGGTFSLMASVSMGFGSKLYETFGVVPNGTSIDADAFTWYWLVTFIGTLSLPLGVLVTMVFIPRGRQTDEVEDHKPETMTHNSVWERFRGKHTGVSPKNVKTTWSESA